MTITPALNTVVSTIPYLIDTNDKEAVIKGIENLQRALANVPNLKWLHPAPGTTARQYVTNMVVSPSNRRANHWIGTNKLGNQDGRINNGDSVVDTNTRVYGTDNLFVVDASIFPGMVTANPSAYFVVAAEHAAAKILALPAGKAQPIYQQCGGLEWRGSFQCAAGLKCVDLNPYYSQVSFSDNRCSTHCILTSTCSASTAEAGHIGLQRRKGERGCRPGAEFDSLSILTCLAVHIKVWHHASCRTYHFNLFFLRASPVKCFCSVMVSDVNCGTRPSLLMFLFCISNNGYNCCLE